MMQQTPSMIVTIKMQLQFIYKLPDILQGKEKSALDFLFFKIYVFECITIHLYYSFNKVLKLM